MPELSKKDFDEIKNGIDAFLSPYKKDIYSEIVLGILFEHLYNKDNEEAFSVFGQTGQNGDQDCKSHPDDRGVLPNQSQESQRLGTNSADGTANT